MIVIRAGNRMGSRGGSGSMWYGEPALSLLSPELQLSCGLSCAGDRMITLWPGVKRLGLPCARALCREREPRSERETTTSNGFSGTITVTVRKGGWTMCDNLGDVASIQTILPALKAVEGHLSHVACWNLNVQVTCTSAFLRASLGSVGAASKTLV